MEPFESSGDPLFGRSFYTHILWTLEKLVWIKEYSVRAINLLITLDEKNFEYKLTNCPMDSLLKIFCFWHPQGALTIEERDTLLAYIIDTHHGIGRKLVNKLLPKGRSMTTDLLQFSWRYVEYREPTITNAQYRNSINCIATKYVQTIDANYEDWEIIIKHFTIFSNIFLELKIDIIHRGLELSESDRLKLCAKMASHISRERKFLEDSNTSQICIINEMEKLYNSLLPDSPLKYAHYYSHDFYGLNPVIFETDDYDYYREEENLRKLRLTALEDTLDKFGFDEVLALAQNVREPRLLIDSLINSKYFSCIDMSFIIKAHPVFPEFAENLINSIYYIKGLSFFSDKLNDISEKDIKWILVQFPIKPDVVEFIKAFPKNIQKEFWECVDSWGIMHCEESFARSCINTLLNYNRPYSAIRELRFANYLDTNLILKALQAALDYHPNTEKNGINLNNIDSYSIEGLFINIYKDPSIDITRVSQLELAYLNKFDIDFEPKCLVENALNNPHVFLELISCCFKKDDGTSCEILKGKEYLVNLALKALERIKKLPGQTGNIVNSEGFNAWIQSVLELAKELKYTTACDIQIGRLLSYSPIGDDGIWPHECVRKFLEKNTSETINRNICTGLFNQRGFHAVTGGDEEERIAATYSEYAQKLQLKYPKTSHILKEISDKYKREAKFERARELKGYY